MIGPLQALLSFETPVDVEALDEVATVVMAGPADALITWDLSLPAEGMRPRQSTLHMMLLGPYDQKRLAPRHRPLPSPAAEARLTVPGRCDSRRSLAEISGVVVRNHPGIVPDEAEFRRFVARGIENNKR